MKRLLPILFLICTLTSVAQERGDQDPNGSKVEALKIAYLTKKLNLSPQEAQRFWPIYNNYANELRSTKKDQRNNRASELETEQKILDIRKKYNAEFGKVLNAEKVNTLFRSEKDFGNFVQKELAERRQLRQLQLNKERPLR